MKDIKVLHSFNLEKEVEVNKTEEKIENGEKISVTKKVKEKTPITFALKKPSRKEREDAEMYYSAFVGECVKKGLLTRAMLLNKYHDTGGEITKEEAKYLRDIYSRSVEIDNQIQRLSANREKNADAIEKAQEEYYYIRRQIADFQTNRSLLYKDTAEAKAEQRVVLWLLLTLSYTRENEDSHYKPLFPGAEIDDKLEVFDELSEDEDTFYDDAIERLTTYVTLLYLGSAKVAEDFVMFDKELEQDAEGKAPEKTEEEKAEKEKPKEKKVEEKKTEDKKKAEEEKVEEKK